MRRNIAAERREILASTGPEGMGFRRFDKAVDPKGDVYVFLGIRDGEDHLEKEDAKETLFVKVGVFDFQYWKKQG